MKINEKEYPERTKKEKNKLTFFEFTIEVFGWLQIVASPFLIGLVIAAIIYLSDPNTTRLIIAIAILLTGLIAGIVIATRIWKKQGTNHFMSGIMATPDLDNLDEEKE